ncbi:MAG: hypothetical protein PHQ59_01295 [Candidatus Daviesbacteria bacterium]|nr:hypothetical protein [Candidatus Daviesbacteria bacterium]
MAKKATKNIMCCDKTSTCCIANLIVGIGIGALLANLLFGLHPIKWGIGLIAVGVLIYLYPRIIKK